MKDWYLINNSTSPNSIGGFENQYFNDYKNDAFFEALTTDIADDLILYNYDLSKSIYFRGIIQGNTADTQLKSMERSLLVPIGILHSGDYVFFENEYWIVDGRPGNNKIYEKATLKECQYKLRWQKDNGEIVERYGNFSSASKYDVGEKGNKTVMFTSNNLSIILPNDDDSQTIDGKRVFIDLKDLPSKVFKITRNDDILFYHGSHGGTLSLIADKDEFNVEKDNRELRICDYIDTTTSSPLSMKQSKILSINHRGKTEIKIGTNPKAFTGIITDDNGNCLSEIGNFEIISTDELLPFIHYEIKDNMILINIDDEEIAIGSKIRLKFQTGDMQYSTFLDLDIVNLF